MAPAIDVPVPQPTNIPADIQSKHPSIATPSLPPSLTTLVLAPTFITTDFDLLRFHAAAHAQLLLPSIPHTTPLSPLLISSPYNAPGHFLDLSTLPPSSALFAKALTALAPAVPDYATASYAQALNFGAVIDVLRGLVRDEGVQWCEMSFYVVVFQSKLKEHVDGEWLYKLDYEAHREACESGGLLKYWFGRANGARENLATCFWIDRAHAQKGGAGPWHGKARRAGRELYERIAFSTWRFVVEEGVEGWRVEEWVE